MTFSGPPEPVAVSYTNQNAATISLVHPGSGRSGRWRCSCHASLTNLSYEAVFQTSEQHAVWHTNRGDSVTIEAGGMKP